MKCNAAVCLNIVTQNSFDWRPYNPDNFSEGVIYFAEGEPYLGTDASYRTLDIEWWIHCSPGTDITPSFIVDDSDALTTGLIIAQVNSSAGCPIPTSPPTPTPAYNPKCRYVSRWTANQSLGVQIDLAELNDGPFGVKSLSLGNSVLYFQACERMTCPPLYQCPEDLGSLSSAWLCNSTSWECVSYGVGVDAVDVKPKNSDVSQGIILSMSNPANSRSVELWLTCEEHGFPAGHINWSQSATIDNGRLQLQGSALETCLKVIEPPGNQTCNFSVVNDQRSLQLDLEQLNRGGGYQALVNVRGVPGYPDSLLYYQPCGSLFCPTGTFCQGVEDAAIWLCRDESGIQLCTAYGLWENNLTMSLLYPETPEGGVGAVYIGDMRYTAQVSYFCNRSMAYGEIALPSGVTLVGDQMRFIIMSRNACVQPDPSPSQSPNSTPSPSQIPSPSQSDTPSTSPSNTPSYSESPSPNNGTVEPAAATGGAVFVVVILLGGIVYVAAGVAINWLRTGIPEIPNANFWTEVGECIVTAVQWIVSCGESSKDWPLYEKVGSPPGA
jgi:hypothetical protein